ncbi:MAG TPA: ergothioneine biosynthesis protein EgtC [Leptolyngbyaceae cyanobacterium M65_K2018_010]|nr:ergothioneine biosynthesis protein EgtC [Leptolyngbyaceae cyanobacterium M65_K2018_010]
MCRLLAYAGPPIQLDRLVYAPEHSLIVQSYQPKEMEVAILNGDGVGLGWYHPERQEAPYLYRNTLPAWNDVNLPHLCRYIEAGNLLAHVRSATPGLAVDLHNCQPFAWGRLSFIHNGFIENFRHTLYRPIRDRLPDHIYQTIHGLTDSEHIFAMVVHSLEAGAPTLSAALRRVLHDLASLAAPGGVRVAANIVLSDGAQLVASRYDNTGKSPSLYCLRDHPDFPHAVLLASEPLFEADWRRCPENSLITVTPNRELTFSALADTPSPTDLTISVRTAPAA